MLLVVERNAAPRDQVTGLMGWRSWLVDWVELAGRCRSGPVNGPSPPAACATIDATVPAETGGQPIGRARYRDGPAATSAVLQPMLGLVCGEIGGGSNTCRASVVTTGQRPDCGVTKAPSFKNLID